MPSVAYMESQLYNDASLPFQCNGTNSVSNTLIRFENFPQLLGVVLLGGLLKF